MTPERWGRIDDLFDASLKVAPPDRESWLRGAGGDDESLRVEVARLLELDERAARDRFLPGPEGSGRTPDPTASWPSRDGPPPRGPEPIDDEARTGDTTVFSPRAAIAAGSQPSPISAAESVVCGRGSASCR